MRLLFSLIISITTLWSLELDNNIENSNILGYQKEIGTLNYNRVRLYTDLYIQKWEDISASLIVNNENFYNIKTNHHQNRSSIYRAHITYHGEKHLLKLGLQRIPFGVGRIYNPIDIFNPIDITEVETDERKGTEALRYEYAINQLSNLDLTLSKHKRALRLKGYLEVADIALILLKDHQKNLEIIGYEIEGELPQSNITFRSEGGRFEEKQKNEIYYHYIVGAEYGFENSLTLLGEFHHNTLHNHKHFALNLSYQPSPLWILNAITLQNIDDKSILLSPSLTYSLSDESTLQMGIFFYDGKQNSEFSQLEDRFFTHYFINF